MQGLTWVGSILLALLVAALIAAQVGAFSGAQPEDLGVRDGKLKRPSKTPNSVSSQAELWAGHPQRHYARIAPLALRGDGGATLDRLEAIVRALPGARVVERRPDYLYAQVTTRWMKFVDDLEFWVDPAAGVVQVRSASRVGRKDFGVNRERVEAIRAQLAAP